MFISDINVNAKRALKTAVVYLLISLFCGIFSAVYEMFSHQVYSSYMIFAFSFPLVGGTMPFIILSMIHNSKYPCSFARNLYHSAIATFTVGSVLRGVLDIYGTTNSLANYYFPVALIFLIGALISYTLQLIVFRAN